MSDPVVEQVTCSLCNHEIPKADAFSIYAGGALQGRIACTTCVGTVQRELDAQRPSHKTLALAAGGGLAGALIGAVAWAGIAIATDLEVGYVAVLVGFLAGFGVKYVAGKQRGRPLQYLAASLALVGLLAAKYIIFAHAVVSLGRERGVDIGYLDPRIFQLMPKMLSETFNGFDVLFVLLAISAAWRDPKATAISISKLRP